LEKADIGIICLTSENLGAPWILFESGALSKSIDRARVCTYLFDVTSTDVQFPLAMFQNTIANKNQTRDLLSTINNALREKRLSETALTEAFDVWWGKLEAQFDEIRKTPSEKVPKRPQEEILEEILGLLRVQQLTPAQRLSEAMCEWIAKSLKEKVSERIHTQLGPQIGLAIDKMLDTADLEKQLKKMLAEKVTSERLPFPEIEGSINAAVEKRE
jgi:hypothetical protein